jgi:hypothetical protein
MKLKSLALLATAAFLLPAGGRAQVPASPPAPGLTVVNVPLLLPPQPGVRPAAEIAHVEVRLASGVGGIVFTQRLPPEAGKMLSAVTAQIEKLHPGKLRNGRTEITFTGSVSAQDLAAAGLAIAVALDAAAGGWTPDPGFMAMATFEADGDVQPVKDAIPRLLAVLQAGAKRVVMTEKQVAQATDLMITSGPAQFAATQFFSVNSYEDVRAIADTRPTPEMAKALREFGDVQRRLAAPGAKVNDILRDPDVQEALRQTLTAAPTCLSARLLLRVTTGQFEKLSVEGTVLAIENMAPTVFTAVLSRAPNDLTKLPNPVVQAEITRLLAAKEHFDRRSLPLLDAVIGYGEAVRTYTERPPDSPAENVARNRTLILTAREVVATLANFKAAKR